MSKEIKVGMVVLSVLLMIFGTLLYRRLTHAGEQPLAASPTQEFKPVPDAAPPGALAALSSLTTSSADASDQLERPRPERWVNAEAPEQRRERPPADDAASAQNSFTQRRFTAPAQPLANEVAAEARAEDEPRQMTNSASEPGPPADLFARPLAPPAEVAEPAQRDYVRAAVAEPPQEEPPAAIDRYQGRDAVPTGAAQPVTDARDPANFPQAIAEQSQPLDTRRSAQTESTSRLVRTSRAGALPAQLPPDGKYSVAPNDNFWTISEKSYGTGGYFKALQDHNRQRYPRPEKMQVGDIVDVPPSEELQQKYPGLCPKQRNVASKNRAVAVQASTHARVGGRVYVVEKGDTLFDIARYELGKPSRWAEIYDLNQDVLGDDFHFLEPGTELVLPNDRPSETLTKQREGTLKR